MKKLLFGLFAAVLIGGAGCSSTPLPVEPAQPPVTTPETPTTTPAADLQVYKNVQYNFEFSYPKGLGFAAPNYANMDNKIVQVQLSADAYPGTNFRDGGVAVSSGSADILNGCLAQSPIAGGKGFKNKVTINGVEFYTDEGIDAGAGNFYVSKAYRTFHNSQCFEIVETIHTTNVANYPDGTVSEVVKEPIWAELNSIVQSFKFNS